jgi:hypothetical protein
MTWRCGSVARACLERITALNWTELHSGNSLYLSLSTSKPSTGGPGADPRGSRCYCALFEVCSNRVTDVQDLSVAVSLSVSNSRVIRRVSLQKPHELVLQCRLKGTLTVD